MLLRVAFAALAFAIAAPGAMALEGAIEGVAILFPPPAGFCELINTNSSDKRVLDTLGATISKGGNRLISLSADCQQLADWRAGKRKLLDDLANYQTIGASAAATKEGYDLVCTDLKTRGDEIVSRDKSDWKANIEQVNKRVQVNETTYGGYLGEDPRACYAALLQKLKTEAGTEKSVITLMATTIIKGKFIFVYRTETFANADATNRALDKLKRTVAALHAANP